MEDRITIDPAICNGRPVVRGTRITVQGRAPLNDPVALRVMGGTLTLRNNEAEHIEVETEEVTG